MPRSGSSKPPWRIAGYCAEELIGSGATSQVWRGRASRTGAPVALKVLQSTDAGTQRAARAEAALLSALDHPHLLRLHELVSDGRRAVLVLDYAAGGTFADLLDRRISITVGEVVSAMSPLAAAVAYIHEQGLVHGDISPANILFTAQGQPLLADLGVATMCGAVEDVHSTLSYVDPAVASGGVAGQPSDVFMLAAVSLHALSGRPPWVAPTAQGLVDQAAVGDVPDLDALLADVPAAVAAVVRRGLAVLPHARGTAAEFALDLRHAAPPAPLELAAGRVRLEAGDHGANTDGPGADDRAGVDGAGADDRAGADGAGTVGCVSVAGSGKYRARHSGQPASVSGLPAPSRRRPSFAGESAAPPFDVELERPNFARPGAHGDAGITRPGGHGQWPQSSPDDESAARSLTHQVRARTRPALPPPPRFGGRIRRYALAAAATVAVLAGVAAWFAAGWKLPAMAHRGRPDVPITSAAAPGDSRTAPTSAARTRSASASALQRPTTSAPSASPPTAGRSASAENWQRVLNALDAHRQHAFAAADPAELALVYVAGPLRRQDAAAMHRTLGPGCTLTGLRTTYRILRTTVDPGGRATVTATASLAPADLRCPARGERHTVALRAGELRIQLVATSAGYRICGLQAGKSV